MFNKNMAQLAVKKVFFTIFIALTPGYQYFVGVPFISSLSGWVGRSVLTLKLSRKECALVGGATIFFRTSHFRITQDFTLLLCTHTFYTH